MLAQEIVTIKAECVKSKNCRWSEEENLREK